MSLLDRLPRVVLVETSHPGNIGAAARAMKTMGLNELVLVGPRRFPDQEATARASGADDVLQQARVVESLADALVDCHFVVGLSARPRHMEIPTRTPRELFSELAKTDEQGKVGLVFGRERSGLTNEELDQCHELCVIPANPEYASLNVAAAVQVMSYEWRAHTAALSRASEQSSSVEADPLADASELEGLYAHYQQVLVEIGYLDLANPRHLMRRLRRLYSRSRMTRSELNILRGILKHTQKRH